MPVTIAPNPKQQFFNAAGQPLSGGKLFTYAPNTTTSKATYSDAAGTVANTNPIILDARGEALIYWDGVYSIALQDALGNSVYSVDNYPNSSVLQLVNKVTSIAALKALRVPQGSDAQTVIVDGQAEPIVWNATSTATDDGGITFLPNSLTSGQAGRWVRQFTSSISVQWFGAKADGTTDDTGAFNAAILAAYNAMANVLSPAGDIYSVEVRCLPGKDYKIAGTILLPSQVVLNGNGCRFVGISGSANTTAYSSAGQSCINTAIYQNGALSSNSSAANDQTDRVVGAGIKNIAFVNFNCALDLVNFQERCFLENLSYNNCSAPRRLKQCYYMKSSRSIIRNSSLAANQGATLLYGTSAHAMDFDQDFTVGASIGIHVTAANSIGVRFKGSLEEAYQTVGAGSVNGTGILIDGAYCQAWDLDSMYFEGVQTGIGFANNGAFYACNFSAQYFSGCEYAILAIASALRQCSWDTTSFSDGGGNIRNIADFSAPNNDVLIRLPAKASDIGTGLKYFPSNLIAGSGCQVIATSYWRDTTDTTAGTNILAMCDGRLANKASIGPFAWEGAQMVTKANQMPFATVTAPSPYTTVVIDTYLNYDASNMLCCHLVITDYNGTYTFDALIFGTAVYPLAAFNAGKGLTVSNNGGYVEVTVTGLNTNSGNSYGFQGGIRHM